MAEEPKRPENQLPAEVSACPGCERRFLVFTRKHNCLGCGKVFCKRCLNNWIYFPKEYQYDTVQNCCQDCYKELSSIDHTITFERFGDEHKDKTIILLHPATLTRKFWSYHANILSQKYRVYAMDIPGHGSRMDIPLNVNAAHDAITSLAIEEGLEPNKFVLWGHGMGGYLAISYGGANPGFCTAIIATNCGAGVDSSSSALRMAGHSLLLNVTKNSTLAGRPKEYLKDVEIKEEDIMENFLRPGTYYREWDGILSSVNVKNYLELLRNFDGKILFLNGSLCERDAEERFVGAAQEATLETLDQAGEWFIVDHRFRKKSLELVDEFLETVDWSQMGRKLVLPERPEPEIGGNEKESEVKGEPEEVGEESEEEEEGKKEEPKEGEEEVEVEESKKDVKEEISTENSVEDKVEPEIEVKEIDTDDIPVVVEDVISVDDKEEEKEIVSENEEIKEVKESETTVESKEEEESAEPTDNNEETVEPVQDEEKESVVESSEEKPEKEEEEPVTKSEEKEIETTDETTEENVTNE